MISPSVQEDPDCLWAPVWSWSELSSVAVWLPRLPPSLPCLLSWPFPPANVTTSLHSLVHVWLQSMHGTGQRCKDGTLHTVLFGSLSKMGFIMFQLFILHSLPFGIQFLTAFWIGTKWTPFLKGQSFLKSYPSGFWQPSLPFFSFWMPH